MEFKEVKFDITSNISLIVSLAYYNGHPMVETKKTKINYNGTIIEVNRDNKNNEVLMNKLTSRSLYSIFSIELVNYLNRLINGDNLYDVYVNSSNKMDRPEELIDYVFKPEKQCSRAGALDIRSKYINDLINQDSKINLDLLDQHRNSKYPTCVHNFEEINYVPIYTYIHPTLAKNRGETIHIMHLGLLFQLLTRIKGLPEFNTQASMSILNTAIRSEQIGVTIETVNKSQYDDLVKENKRLQNKLQKKQSRLDMVIEQNKQLIEQNNKLLSENDDLKQDIDDLMNLNISSNQNVTLLRRDVGYLSNDIHDMSTAISEVNERVGILSINNQKLNAVHDVFIIYFSESKPVDIDKRNDCADDEIWLGTFNGQLSNYRRTVPKDAYTLYQIDSNRLDTFKFITENDVLEEFILDVYQRSIKIYMANFHRFIDEIDRIMNADGKYEVVRNLQIINDRIKNNERRHNELNRLQHRKRYLLEHYNDMHIIISRYKRRVYAKIDEDRRIPVNQVENAYNYPWFYRYGVGGKHGTEILEPLLTQDIFTNDHDPRIRYE